MLQKQNKTKEHFVESFLLNLFKYFLRKIIK